MILVPGLTGTMLRQPGGRVVWGTGWRLLSPHDGGALTARPLDTDPASRGDLEAFAVIEHVRVAGLFHTPVYGPVVELLERQGYRAGNLEDPAPEDNLFLFPYDWRQDNILSAHRLFEALERLARARGEAPLAVSLVCQSNGGSICRYLAKYGRATLEEAESGHAFPPGSVRIDRIVLVGTSSGGSLRTLREMDRGRRYVPLIGRRLRPETVFSYVSLYQDLPAYAEDLFLDSEGRPLDIDVFDPDTWKRLSWSVYRPDVRRRLARADSPAVFGDEAAREAFLRWALDRGRRLQRLLVRDPEGFVPPRFYMIQNFYEETPRRAVLLDKDGEPRLLFTGDRELRRRPYLHARASAVGDGHATLDSQQFLSAVERAALAADPYYVNAEHFAMILDRGAMRRLVEYLAD